MDAQSINRVSTLPTVRVPRLFATLALLLTPLLAAQRPANSNVIYKQLRSLLPGGEVVSVSNFELHRDAAILTFTRGDFAFYGEVSGKVTGAVFRGQGHFHLTPPTPEERHNLKILAKSEEFDEDFDRAVLRFTDATAQNIHAAAAGKAQPDSVFAQSAEDYRDFQRKKLLQNVDLRLLEDVLSPSQSGFFMAAMRGSTNHHLVFTIDPHGARYVSPEEVSLLSWSDWGETYPAAFPRNQPSDGSAGVPDGQNSAYRITHEDLDVSIEKSGFLSGSASCTSSPCRMASQWCDFRSFLHSA